MRYFYVLGNPVDGTIAEGQTRVVQNDIRVLDIVGTRVYLFFTSPPLPLY